VAPTPPPVREAAGLGEAAANNRSPIARGLRVRTAAPLSLASAPAGTRVAVVRLRSLGDTILSTPALAALKQWRPDLRIAYLVEPQFGPIIASHPCVEKTIVVGRGTRARWSALRQLRAWSPGFVVNLHGGATASWLTRAAGAPARVCFEGMRNAWMHNVLVPPAIPPEGRARLHTVEHIASVFHALGMPPAPLGPAEIALDGAAVERMRARRRELGIADAYAFINAGARSHDMVWPAPRFIELLRWLSGRYGLATVLARAASEAGVEEPIVSALQPEVSAALFAGTSVADLAALEADAALMFGNDGGPVHIAAAFQRPVVVLYSITDAEVWHPWRTKYRIVQHPRMEMTLEEVQRAVEEVME
jgi:heptosyltransferase-3